MRLMLIRMRLEMWDYTSNIKFILEVYKSIAFQEYLKKSWHICM